MILYSFILYNYYDLYRFHGTHIQIYPSSSLQTKNQPSGYETHAASSILIRWRTIGRRFDPKTLNSTKVWLWGNSTNVIYICLYVIYFLHYNY